MSSRLQVIEDTEHERVHDRVAAIDMETGREVAISYTISKDVASLTRPI